MSSRPEKPTPEVDPQTGMVEEIGPGTDRRRALFLVIMFGVTALGIWIAIKLGLFQFTKWFESLFVGTWLESFGFLISLPIIVFLCLVLMFLGGGGVAEVVFMLFLNKKRFGAPGGLYDPRVLARIQCLYCGYPRKNNDSECCSECGKPYEPNDQQPDS